MRDGEQYELDLRLDWERDLEENIGVMTEFVHQQLLESAVSEVKNRHEGYGILAENMVAVNGALKGVKGGMDNLLKVLPVDDFKAIDEVASIDNSLTQLITTALQMSAEAKRISEDLYHKVSLTKTPMEEYLESQTETADGFSEVENAEEDE